MCWSADADLIAGSAIAVLGAASLAGVRRWRDVPLAAVPLILGAHQIVESFVWRAQDGTISASAGDAARTAWVVIALPILPTFVPAAVLLASLPARAREVRLSVAFLAIGIVTSIVLTVDVARAPATAQVHGHTLGYGIGVPSIRLVLVGYIVATVGPLITARDWDVRLVGIASLVGALVCGLLWQVEFISTWCALAAVVSVLLVRWSFRSGPRRLAAVR